LIEKISNLDVSDEPPTVGFQQLQLTSLVFFLSETYEHHFDALTRDIKKCFFSPFDLKKLEIFTTNHQRMMMARVFHVAQNFTGLSNSKSTLFTTFIGGDLYSRQLKGTFKVFSDICQVAKVKELINY